MAVPKAPGAPTNVAAPPTQRPRRQELEPGAIVCFSRKAFAITEPLGRGSFGVVWGGRAADGTRVAIKEIPCKSEAELGRVVAEGQLLKKVKEELLVAGGGRFASCVPVLLASDVEVVMEGWRVRLVMSEVPGRPLEEVLESRRRALGAQRITSVDELRAKFVQSCRLAGEVVVQLAPILEAISPKVYHRDITPRNIQVTGLDADSPKFGLVDFGLAVDAPTWRTQDSGDLVGDGRYWPPSAWLVFSRGTAELKKYPALEDEYRHRLDMFSLSLSALRCFVETMPNLDLDVDFERNPWLSNVVVSFRRIEAAWKRYWADACGLWEPVFDAFRGNGDFDALRSKYRCARVESIISEDVQALQEALELGKVACLGVPANSGLVGMPNLFDAILFMLCNGQPVARIPLNVGVELLGRSASGTKGTSGSMGSTLSDSTGTPASSSPSSGIAKFRTAPRSPSPTFREGDVTMPAVFTCGASRMRSVARSSSPAPRASRTVSSLARSTSPVLVPPRAGQACLVRKSAVSWMPASSRRSTMVRVSRALSPKA
mmetsp:Transcript_68524/g.198816  ORF Transcript_68524/g.198816 Transcript_68524/m.198816 type:complete len:545 (-) Transcript_68524:416-2050(-)